MWQRGTAGGVSGGSRSWAPAGGQGAPPGPRARLAKAQATRTVALAGAAAVALLAGGLAYGVVAAQGQRGPRARVLRPLADLHPQWPDHYNHFILTVPAPQVLVRTAAARQVKVGPRDLRASSLRAAGSHVGPRSGHVQVSSLGTAADPAANAQPAGKAGHPASRAASGTSGIPLQSAAPNAADPIVLRAGEPVSLLPSRLARYPKGTVLERDSQGNLRAVLPPGSAGPRATWGGTRPRADRATSPPKASWGAPHRATHLAPGAQAGSAQVVRSLLAIPGVHDASHVWGDRYQVATSLSRAQLARLAGVGSVVDNNLLTFSSSSAPATNDPYLADEYYIDNTGQAVLGQAGTPGASGDFAYAWARSRGAGVVVADIDTGVDLNNPDLASQVLPTSENFTVSPPNNDVQAQGTATGFYHATTVDGVLAAAAGNGTEGAGAAPEARILALKCSDDSTLSDSCIYEAGEYAISQHVTVINMSFDEQTSSDPTLASLVSDAQKAGILITASAGNSGTDNDTTPQLPAGLEATYDNIITVGATDNQDNLATYSDYGASTVDLMAPGTNVFTDYPTYTGYPNAYASGTSYSAPLVAATAALLWSADPSLSYSQVKYDILGSVQKVPGLSGKCVTGGRLDAQAALALVAEPVQWDFTGFDQVPPDQAASASISVSAQPGVLPSGVPLGYHLALVYDYQGSMYYVTNLSFDWSIAGSSPQPVTTGADGSAFIAPPGTDAANYGSSPLDISFGSSGLPPGYYGLVAYAAQVQSGGSAGPPIGNEQAVFFDVGSVPLPPPPSSTTTTAPATTTVPATTTTVPATTTTTGAGGATTTTAGATTTTAGTTTTTTPVTTVPPGTTPTVVQTTTTTTPTSTTTTAASTTTTAAGTTTTTAGTTTTTAAGTTTTTAAGATTTTTGGGTTTTTAGAGFWLTYVSPNQLPTSGGQVQVFGNNLPPNPVVEVGSQGEAVTSATSTEVDVTVGPMLAGTYSVTVYNSTQTQSASLSAALTIGSGSGTTTTTAAGTTTTTAGSGTTTTTAGTTTTSSTPTTVVGTTTTTTGATTTTSAAGTTTTTAGTTTTTALATTTTGTGGTISQPNGSVLAPVAPSDSIGTVSVGEWPAFSASQIIADSGGSPGSSVPGVDV